MKYIRLFEERMKDFEIMTLYHDSLMEIIREEINKKDYDIDYIKDLVNWGHFDINQIWDEFGEETNLLFKAITLNDIDLVRFLLEASANPNVQDTYQVSPLMTASYLGFGEIVKELLKHPIIQVNNQDIDGFTALMGASEKNKIDIVQDILYHPMVDIKIKDIKDKTAWDWATPDVRKIFPQLNPYR